MRPTRPITLPALGILAALAVGACAGSAQQVPTWTFPPVASAAPASAELAAGAGRTTLAGPAAAPNAALATAGGASGIVTRLDLTIVTGDMIGHTEFPAYVPSSFTLPANSMVVVTITNFDNATPLPKGAESYAKVSGTVGGTMTSTPIRSAYPNGSAGTTQTLASLDPATVSHTFTIAALGINVPIPAMSRTTFTIHTGAPGTYTWRCMDPCGAGATGWGTAMAARTGFMEGTLTVA
ncbi:MAG: cupredoxin domain-containing protein [Candidatus Limnocylindrales bacterium]